ncbi:MAG: PatB family C-S lyase, partial [Thiovulaceae bacterium]|nr:PatB family C-S lyase [Sulfurimonadaceae bacterium]
ATHRDQSDAEKYQKREKLFGTDDVYPMWVADMEFQAAPAIVNALRQRAEHGVYGYAEPDSELFDLASSWLGKRHALDVSSDLIRSSPSIMTTMSAAVEAFSDKGDGVTVMTPIYPPFLEVVQTQERVLHTVTLTQGESRFEIDFDALERALEKSSLFLLCNPHNPVGRVWEIAELEKMAQLCLKHEVFIISDDAHCDIVMPGFTYQSITQVNEEIKKQSLTLFGPGKGFNVSGLSATLFFSHSKDILKAVEKVFKARHVVAGQFMAYEAVKGAYGHSDVWLDELIPYLDANFEFALKQINEKMPKLKAFKSEGTYLLWIDCEGMGLSDHKLKQFFVEKAHLGLSQGRFFGAGGSGFMRMNMAVQKDALEKAFRDLFLAYNNNL